MYSEGIGTSQNITEAIHLYKAVAKVEFMACIALGRIYSRDKDVQVNVREAVRWYSEALTWEDRVNDHDSIQEARKYVASFSI